MENYILDANYGSQQMKLPIDFDPSKFTTAADAAKAFYAALYPVVRKCFNQNPDVELALWSPEEAEQRGYQKAWMVSWESGPWEWGVATSLAWLFNRTAGWYTEPHYSFDVSFVR